MDVRRACKIIKIIRKKALLHVQRPLQALGVTAQILDKILDKHI